MYEPFVKRRDFLFSMSTLGAWTLMGGPAHALERLSASPAPRSPWLSGNFAPVMDELNVDNLLVEGAIPKNLNGTFLRNGPNPIYPANPYHWFDGDGMIHGVSIKDGKASYANRFVLTEGFEREKAAGKSLYGGFLAGPPFKNAANISIVHHHGKTLAAWEGGSPYEINSSTLATVGSYDFEKQWATAFTAHPKIDPVTDQMVFFGYDFKPPYLHYGVLSPTGKLIHSTTIDIPNPVMIHDFAITENYSIFLDLPLVFSERGLKFTPSAGARMGVLPRLGKNSDVKWFNIETCWVAHEFGSTPRVAPQSQIWNSKRKHSRYRLHGVSDRQSTCRRTKTPIRLCSIERTKLSNGVCQIRSRQSNERSLRLRPQQIRWRNLLCPR
jgi:carotenoid cleavage dioxygenase-like enzyme